LDTSTGYALVLGYLSGSVLYHRLEDDLPKRSCLRLQFTDGSYLTATISPWGLIRALNGEEGQEYLTKWYGRAIAPLPKEFTWRGFRDAVTQIQNPKRLQWCGAWG
jgi:hypothetical protein